MRPIVTDGVAWSVGLSVGLSRVSPTKTAELIEMPFGLWTRVGPRNHVWGQIPQRKGTVLRGEGQWAAHCKV